LILFRASPSRRRAKTSRRRAKTTLVKGGGAHFAAKISRVPFAKINGGSSRSCPSQRRRHRRHSAKFVPPGSAVAVTWVTVIKRGATQTRHRSKLSSEINGGRRTVNPLAYAFVGSSPTSPTTLKIKGNLENRLTQKRPVLCRVCCSFFLNDFNGC